METVTLYRELGKILHTLGAYRVVLLNAKYTTGHSAEMFLEIAVDGDLDIKEAEKTCAEQFRMVDIKLIDLNDFSNASLLEEAIEDGIQL